MDDETKESCFWKRKHLDNSFRINIAIFLIGFLFFNQVI